MRVLLIGIMCLFFSIPFKRLADAAFDTKNDHLAVLFYSLNIILSLGMWLLIPAGLVLMFW